MYNPSLVGDPNCYSSSIPSAEVHAAAGPVNHWFYLLAEGTNPTDGQPTSPTCNGTHGHRHRHPERRQDLLQRDADEDDRHAVPEVPHLDADGRQEPAPRATAPTFNTVKAAWDAVSVPAQAGDPTCSGRRHAVTVTNPGNQTGTVGTAASLQLAAHRRHRRRTPGRPPASRPGLSINASTGLISGTPTTAGTVHRRSSTATPGARRRQHDAFTWTINPPAAAAPAPARSSATPASSPATRRGRRPPACSATPSGQTAHAGTRYAWLDGYGTTHTDTLSAVGDDPGRLHQLHALVLAAHRLGRDARPPPSSTS